MNKQAVVVTGATKGIGLAISRYLYENHYLVIGIARNKIDDFPGDLVLCDLSNSQSTQSSLNDINTQYPNQIYGVINNVGIANPQPLEEIDLVSLYSVFDLNVRTALQATQAFINQMKNNKSGRIINIASRAVFGVKNRSSYAAAKAALIGLTRTWALELAPYHITVNSISPGPIETELFRKTRPIGSIAEQETLASIPLGRIGTPNEIAATVGFILSENAGFITGQNICVDGGGSL